MKKVLKILFIFITILSCTAIGFIIFVMTVFTYTGSATPKAALPLSVKGRQSELYNLLLNKICDGKESEINSCAKELLSDKIKTIYEYRLVNNKIVMSYYPYPWQKLYRRNPDKCSYTLDYAVYPKGKIIVFTYGVPHEHVWDEIAKDKDILVTYSEKSVTDDDFISTFKSHFHPGEYVNKKELDSIMKRMADTNPPIPLSK